MKKTRQNNKLVNLYQVKQYRSVMLCIITILEAESKILDWQNYIHEDKEAVQRKVRIICHLWINITVPLNNFTKIITNKKENQEAIVRILIQIIH